MALSDIDRLLVSNCLAGQEGAWEDFVHRFLPLITHVVDLAAAPKVGRLPAAWREDLVAEVLLALVDRDYAVLRQFRGQSSLGTYLVVVSRRIAMKKLAKMRRAAGKPLNFEDLGHAGAASVVASNGKDAGNAVSNGKQRDEIEQFEDSEEVHSMLGKMPEREAALIRMFHLEHRTYSDIGNQLDIPENSVGPLLSQARDRLKTLRR